MSEEPLSIYVCRCGYRFPAVLGKYGCPNCEGERGAAKLRELTGARIRATILPVPEEQKTK